MATNTGFTNSQLKKVLASVGIKVTDSQINKARKTTGSSGSTTTPTPSAPISTPPSSSSTPKVSSYSGPSVVDYLNSTGQASDFNSRAKLAQSKGIANYVGTADQNTQLLNSLKGSTSAPVTPVAPVVPVVKPTVTPTVTPGATPPATTTPNPTVTPASPYTVTPANGGSGTIPKSTYTGPSVVDYLSSVGLATDRNSRVKLAEQMGVQGYVDASGYISGAKNLELLTKLRGSESNAGATAPTDTPTPPAEPPVPIDPNAINPEDYATLEKYASEAGLSVEEFKKLLGSTEVTQEESDRIKKELGIPDAETSAFAKPSESTVETYNRMYNEAGLEDLKNKIKSIDDEINKDRDQFSEAVGAVNENPWLSESTRVGRVKRLNDQMEEKINNKLEARKQLGDMYDKGVAQIEKTITYQTNDFQNNQALNVAKLNYLIKQAESQETILKNKKSDKFNPVVQDYVAQTAKDATAKDSKPFKVGTHTFQWDATTKSYVDVTAPADLNTGGKKKTDQGLTYTGDDVANFQQSILSYNGGERMSAYQNTLKLWRSKGGSLTGFFKEFPVKDFFPNQTDADLTKNYGEVMPEILEYAKNPPKVSAQEQYYQGLLDGQGGTTE